MPKASAPPPRPDPEVARLAEALGLPEERVARALAGLGASPRALVRAVQAGDGDERLQSLARSLRVERGRLKAALLDAAQDSRALLAGAATAAEGLAKTVQGTAEEALSVGLEIVGETIPRLVNHALIAVAALGFALIAVGALAIINTPLFVQLLAVLAGIGLIVAGLALFTLAWRLHEATATLRTLARVARKLRERRAEAPEN